jgi:hypothetical protein
MTSLTPYTDHLSFNGKEDELEDNAFEQLIRDEIVLPAFYTFADPTSVFTINVEATNALTLITITDDTGEAVGGTFSDLEEAYDFVRTDLKGDVVFTGDLKAVTGNDSLTWVFIPSKHNPKHSRLLLSNTDKDDEYFAKSDYYEFLKLSNQYVHNPTDFKTSFDWLNTHPAFWSRTASTKVVWDTENNDKIFISVFVNKEGKTVVALETGAAVEPERTTRYHDMRLDTCTPTYEESIVELAALVHKFYNVDGVERENVEYVKNKNQLRLEEILARSDSEE